MDTVIPESTEQEVSVEQENATFFVLGDAAYTSEIIEEYNRNAENKTKEFNANSDTKVKEYNTNATNKTTAFDNNYDTKVAAFNKNAETQTETFNSNAITKENSFNANATTSIQNYNANAEQKLYEFNANALAYEEGITDNSNRVKRLETDIFDSGTASGSSINIQDSTLAEFQELTVDGVSKQEISNGKNKVKLPDTSEKTIRDVTVSVENEIVTLNGTNNQDNATNLVKCLDIDLSATEDTDYTLSYTVVSGTKNVKLGISFRDINDSQLDYIQDTTSTSLSTSKIIAKDVINNTSYLYFYIRSQEQINNLKIKVQLEKGNVATNYERFGIRPSPELPSPIDVIDESFNTKSIGRSLVDFSVGAKSSNGGTAVYENGILKITGKKKYSSVVYEILDILRGHSDERITFKADSVDALNKDLPANAQVNIYYNNAGIKYLNLYRFTDGTKWSQVLPTLENANRATLTLYANNTDTEIDTENTIELVRPMLFFGGTNDNPDYEPYQETVSTITLPDGEFAADGDLFRIAFNNEDGKYHLWLDKNISKVVLDESITNVAFTASQNSDTHNTSYISVYKEDVLPNGRVISDYFRYANLWNTDVEGCWIGNSRHIALRIAKEKVSTTENFKTWCAENTPMFCYQLAEPYSLDLGVIDMPISYYPVTNVFTTHDLQPIINVAYYRDIKNTITTMQTDIETLKQAISTLATNQTTLASEVDLLQEQTETESEVIE